MNEHYPKSRDEIRRHFDFFDDDKNGFIDFDEYRDMLNILDQSITSQEATDTFELIDTNNDGQISFDEFLAWWHKLWYED